MIRVDVQVKDTFKMIKKVTLVKLTDWNKNKKIIEGKHNSRKANVYVDNDMSVKCNKN